MRFATAVLNEDSTLLNRDTRAEMLKRPTLVDAANDYSYGCGWQARHVGHDKFDAWHNGTLDGTVSLRVGLLHMNCAVEYG